jgi:hypothetical protein
MVEMALVLEPRADALLERIRDHSLNERAAYKAGRAIMRWSHGDPPDEETEVAETDEVAQTLPATRQVREQIVTTELPPEIRIKLLEGLTNESNNT